MRIIYIEWWLTVSMHKHLPKTFTNICSVTLNMRISTKWWIKDYVVDIEVHVFS